MHCIYFYFLCLPNVVPDGEQRAEGRSVLLSGFAGASKKKKKTYSNLCLRCILYLYELTVK